MLRSAPFQRLPLSVGGGVKKLIIVTAIYGVLFAVATAGFDLAIVGAATVALFGGLGVPALVAGNVVEDRLRRRGTSLGIRGTVLVLAGYLGFVMLQAAFLILATAVIELMVFGRLQFPL